MKKISRKKAALWILLLMWLIPTAYSLATKNPEETNVAGEFAPAEAEFIYDLSYVKDGEKIHEQKIFDREMDIIREAKEFLMVDFFLFNATYDKDVDCPKQVAAMTDRLIEKKRENPAMPILFVTDPINNFYGAYEEANIKRLRDAGIEVVVTDLNRMRDSNPIFSGIYRAYIQWFGTSGNGRIKNFFAKEGEKVTVRSVLKLLNFKGNHRKVVVSENEAMVASANPHDPSAHHSNVAVAFRGKTMEDLIRSESIFFKELPQAVKAFQPPNVESGDQLKLITEGKIYDAISENINKSEKGDKIHIGIFYLSEFRILKDLEAAANRGVDIKIVADLNKDAFGLEKNGAPNRPALSELKEKAPSIQIRWYNTQGEQFHTKMAYFDFKDEKPLAILGSGNFTRRNLDNYNLETDVALEMERNSPTHVAVENYFRRIWTNEDGEYTLPFEEYKDERVLIRPLWKLQEAMGLCTW